MKNGFLKAVNMFTGKKTLIPVSSPHFVKCPDCNYIDNKSKFSPCSYCHGCLDCRYVYMKPLTKIISFSELLDLFDDALLPF